MADQNIQLKSLDGSDLLYPITKAANVKRGTNSTVDADLTSLESTVAGKQEKLGGESNGVVVAGSTAGTVSYRGIDIASASESTNLITSGAVYTELGGKLDDSQLVTSWSATTSDTNIPSEKLVKTYVDNKVSAVFRYKGSVSTVAQLPTSGQEVGDVYNVQTANTDPDQGPVVKAGDNVVWAELTSDPKSYGWDVLSGTVDLSNYYTKTETDGLLDDKVDKVDGSSLMTSAEHTKLAGIAEGAEVNAVAGVKVDGTSVLDDNKIAQIDLATPLATKIDKSKLSINGDTAYSSTVTIVAPTALGTAGQVLKTNSAGTGFAWEDVAEVSVDGTTIGKNADGQLQVKDLGISTAKLAADAVTNAKLADDAVETDNIKDANVTTAKIKDANVTEDKLAADAVVTAKIKDANVTEAKLAADAVVTAKIKDANVTTAKIADGNVTFAKVASDAIVTSTTGIAAAGTASDVKLPTEKAVRAELDKKVTANTDITAGTACKISYDAKGLVTAGAALEASDIPSLTLAKISDVTATAAEVNVLDGITATTAELNVLDGIDVSTTELNYVKGVTSAIQTQLDGKLTAVQAGTNVSIDTTTATQPKVSVANFNGTSDGCVAKSTAATKGKLVLADNATWVAGITYTVVE